MFEIVLSYVIPAIICFILIYICNAYTENENNKINFGGAILFSLIPLFNLLCIGIVAVQIATSEKKLPIDYLFMHSKKDKND